MCLPETKVLHTFMMRNVSFPSLIGFYTLIRNDSYPSLLMWTYLISFHTLIKNALYPSLSMWGYLIGFHTFIRNALYPSPPCEPTASIRDRGTNVCFLPLSTDEPNASIRDRGIDVCFIPLSNLWCITLVGEENKPAFIRAWKPFPNTLRGSPKGKVQRWQYLLAVDLGRYITNVSLTHLQETDVPMWDLDHIYLIILPEIGFHTLARNVLFHCSIKVGSHNSPREVFTPL